MQGAVGVNYTACTENFKFLSEFEFICKKGKNEGQKCRDNVPLKGHVLYLCGILSILKRLVQETIIKRVLIHEGGFIKKYSSM
jgi:hypothetical protein